MKLFGVWVFLHIRMIRLGALSFRQMITIRAIEVREILSKHYYLSQLLNRLFSFPQVASIDWRTLSSSAIPKSSRPRIPTLNGLKWRGNESDKGELSHFVRYRPSADGFCTFTFDYFQHGIFLNLVSSRSVGMIDQRLAASITSAPTWLILLAVQGAC